MPKFAKRMQQRRQASEEFNSIILELIKIFIKKNEDDAVEKNLRPEMKSLRSI